MTPRTQRRHATFTDSEAQLQILQRGIAELITDGELRAKLARQKPLLVKAGFDPTAPDLHLGHTVLLRKLRQFQDLGHKVVFLIGDATALVGDPSGQTQTRPLLTRAQVAANAKTYVAQVARVLDTHRHFRLRYNSEWFLPAATGRGRPFDFARIADLLARGSVERLLERDEFTQRRKAGKGIRMVELFYPLMQGYDSVQLKADIELGGTDQKFNLLVGRDLQRAYGQEPQVVMTLPLLIGTDGVKKMSKSLGNHIALTDSATEMFGKLMSIPDALMERYATLLTDVSWEALKSLHPKAAKVAIAQAIVGQYHGAVEAARQTAEFDRVFRKGQLPTDIPTVQIRGGATPVSLNHLFDEAREVFANHLNIKSRSELRRLVAQRGLRINGEVVASVEACQLRPGATSTLQAGPRRFLRVLCEPATSFCA